MKSLIVALLLQSFFMVPRTAVENPARVSALPAKLQKDYDKLWARFVKGKEDAKVVKDADKLLRKSPASPQLVLVEAYVAFYNNRIPEGESLLERALGLDPKNRIALSYLSDMAFAREDYPRAGALYARLLAADPSRTDVEPKREKAMILAAEDLIRRASRAEQENRIDEAEALYMKAVQLAPQEPSLHARLGDLYAKQKKYDNALAEFSKEREFGGVPEDIDRRTVEVLVNQGRSEEARVLVENLRKSGNRDAALDAKLNELEDIGRWGGDVAVFRKIQAAPEITREQLAALIVRYFPQVAESRRTPQVVTDIQDSWARPEIQIIIGVGVMDPLPNHTFQPASAITRAELTKALARLTRLLRIPQVAAPPLAIADLSASNVLYRDIQSVLSYGLMTVDDADRFNINTVVSGENAVHAVEKLLELARRIQ